MTMKGICKAIGCCLALLAILLFTTQPSRLPAAVLFLPFGLIFVALALLIALVIRKRGHISIRTFRTAAVGATLPVLLLVLQSVGQLTLRDALTLFILFGITYFYMSKVSARPRSNSS